MSLPNSGPYGVPRNLISEVWVTVSAGGITNTVIGSWGTIRRNVGEDITLISDVTLGDSFKINTSGIYAITHTNGYSGGASTVGISRNSTELTTSIATINARDVLAMSIAQQDDDAGEPVCISTVVFLAAGDVIRSHNSINCNSGNSMFRIIKVR